MLLFIEKEPWAKQAKHEKPLISVLKQGDRHEEIAFTSGGVQVKKDWMGINKWKELAQKASSRGATIKVNMMRLGWRCKAIAKKLKDLQCEETTL